MIGQSLAHYKILEKIGAGGMGDVYLAEDTKLKRRVALKVLSSEMAQDRDRLARFRREAQAIAKLSHPNIVTIFSVEETENVHFLTMELVDGKPLAEILPEQGFSVEKLLNIAIPLTEALAAAHAKGITHRDLKPQNVMVSSDGRIKVLDFGFAKFAVPSHEAALDSGLATEARTREGMVIGTVPYMSPEQVQGRPADPSSDVFSLGIMLYEMASGGRPFVGDTAIELLSAILKDTPHPIGELRPELPERLTGIIQKCLAKVPEERYQDASELHQELTGVSTTKASIDATKQESISADYLATGLPGESKPRPKRRGGYEYRSSKTVFGWPIVHIAFSRDPERTKMSVACGGIAIGDMAIGCVAIGALSFGGITIGGASVGLVSFGGAVLGLLTAMGGLGIGGFAAAGLAVGLVAHGGLHFAFLTPTETVLARVTLLAWLLATAGFTIGAVAAAYAWGMAKSSRPP